MAHEESERQPLAPTAERSAGDGAVDQTARHPLQQEVNSTQQDLLNTIADLERSNKGLKAANEEAETKAKAAQAFAENIIDTLHESLIVLDRKLRILAASASFYKTFRIRPEDTIGQLIFNLDGRQWDIPKLRELLLRVIPDTMAVEDFEVEHDFPQLGHRIILINARRIRNADNTDGLCLVTVEDITQRRVAEQALMEREAYLKAVLATAPDGIITIDERGVVKSFSPAAERLFGFTETEVIGNNVSQYLKAGEAKIGRGREVIGLRKDGTELPLRLSVAEMKLPDHRVFVGILHDLTDEKRRNEEHLQAQKMEALGQLAGGIAHDFNNLLTIIIGNNERIQEGVNEGELRALLEQNQNAAERGGGLTKRLLSFAHRSRLEPTTLHLNDRVTSMMDMLQRTIGEGIVVMSAMAPDLWYIRVDPGEVDNALLNLMLNARDAMPSGGTVTVETANQTFGAGAKPADLVPGDYVRLSVVDTGVGMTPDVLKRAVEPFFTTKPLGKGTGLGLASAYGFARQSGGCLVIASAVGEGTTVSVYLPRASGGVPPLASASKPGMPLGDGELVLVVDDDDEVREVTLRRLESLGYAVIEAANGLKAIESCARESVALALIDIVMPGGLSGYEVADELRKLNSGINVLLTTGYDGAGRKSEPEASGNFKVLEKPYTRAELAQAVAEALAG